MAHPRHHLNNAGEHKGADVMHISVENKELSELLCSFWELESLGIKPEKETKMSAEDDYGLEHFKETTMHMGEHYQVCLPRRQENDRNRKVAENRFQHLMRRFRAIGNLYRKSTLLFASSCHHKRRAYYDQGESCL